jgi:cytochrome P450
VFAEPRRFDPHRTQKHLSFGSGVHFCLGSNLARRELETAIDLIFERFPDMALVAGKPVEIVGGVLRGPESMWVRPRG